MLFAVPLFARLFSPVCFANVFRLLFVRRLIFVGFLFAKCCSSMFSRGLFRQLFWFANCCSSVVVRQFLSETRNPNESSGRRPGFPLGFPAKGTYVDHCLRNIHKDFKPKDSGRHILRSTAAEQHWQTKLANNAGEKHWRESPRRKTPGEQTTAKKAANTSGEQIRRT